MAQAWRPKLQNNWVVWKGMAIEIQGITNWGGLKEAFRGCWSPELAAGPGTAGQGRSRRCHAGAALCKHHLIRAFWREKRWESELGATFAASRFHIPGRSQEGWGWGCVWGLARGACSAAAAGERRPGHPCSKKCRNDEKYWNIGSWSRWQQPPASNNLRNCKDFFFQFNVYLWNLAVCLEFTVSCFAFCYPTGLF